VIQRSLWVLIGMLASFSGTFGMQAEEKKDGAPPPAARELEWKDGRVLRILVPVAEPGHERRTSRGAAQASRRRLAGMGVRVLGAALNAVEGPETAYGYYGYYYSYYKTKDEKKKA